MKDKEVGWQEIVWEQSFGGGGEEEREDLWNISIRNIPWNNQGLFHGCIQEAQNSSDQQQ